MLKLSSARMDTAGGYERQDVGAEADTVVYKLGQKQHDIWETYHSLIINIVL